MRVTKLKNSEIFMEKFLCFLLLVIFLYVQNCSKCIVLGETNLNFTTDEESVLAFKSRITSDPSNILATNWSTSNRGSFCSWIGVSCGRHRRRITALDLSGWNLEGTIAPNLGNLTFLTYLDLSYNSFKGRIPEELSGLRRLKVFNLQTNYFSGHVPWFLGTFKQLEQIWLNENFFTGVVPRSLSNLSKLETLVMADNSLHGTVPHETGNLSSLQLLAFSNNQLTGSIPDGIFNISSLQTIALTNNGFSGTIPVNLCDNMPQLYALGLSLNMLSGLIPSNVYRCRYLEILSLSFNQFSGSIPKEIGQLTMLKELYLGNTNLEGVIPREIGNLSRLEIFIMNGTLISGHIPSAIFNISSLVVIDFSKNSLSGILPRSFLLPNLQRLLLQSNNLEGQIFSSLVDCGKLWDIQLSDNEFMGTIPRQVRNLTHLNFMNVQNNKLRGEIPSELGDLKLGMLYLGNNSFFGSIPESIFNISTLNELGFTSNNFRGRLPRNMGTFLPNLVSIFLGMNNFTGTIPNTLSNASNLKYIDIASNSFTGIVPNLGNLRLLLSLNVEANNLTGEHPNQELEFITSLTNCPYLEELHFSLNSFNGILPTSLGNLSTSLKYFTAYGSHIKGSIPHTIGNLSGLESLDLTSNELIGLIPETIGELSQIQNIYLENNRLQGSIPTEFCQLSSLEELYLSGNMLNGPIPKCFGDLKSLRGLFLDSNSLTSVVPSLWNISNLLQLHLSTNFLYGNISSEFQNLKSLWYFDLSWNQFSGDIPNSIGDIQALEILSLAHNNFQGSIPQFIGDLRGLVSLDLSNNNISGVIPMSLESLMFLSFLNLSHNRLVGRIPTGGPFSNFTAQSFMMNYALCGDVRLQVPPCNVHKSSSKHVSLIKFILAPIMSAILAVTLSIWLLRRRHLANKKHHQVEISPLLSWRRISYQELLLATEDLSETNIIGRGSFGSVYKGTLSDGLNIAVKVFNLQVERAIKSFEVECEVMSKIRHRNLVRVISCCSNTDFKALVLEYMPNWSLEKWLYSPNNYLDLLQRLNIAIDVAQALEYLHHGNPLPIIHCDLKPNNILIDDDMMAHVGDFGIAKLFGEGETFHQTITLATIGYMAPEYGSEGKISTSCDVYSYGITLLELFTSKKPTDDMFTEETNLKDWVSNALQEDMVSEVVATGLLDQEDQHFSSKEQCVSSIFDLAIKCLAISPEERINMIETVVILKKIKASFQERSTTR